MPEGSEQEKDGAVVVEDPPRIEAPLPTVPVESIGDLLGTPPRDWRQTATGILAILVPFLIIAVAVIAIRPGVDWNKWILVAVIIVALAFDYVNGMNDAANAIATVVATRVLPPLAALLMAAVMNFMGAVAHTEVAKTIASIYAQPAEATMLMILCGLVGAVVWSWTMTHLGLPVSISHALIGGLIGAAVLANIGLNLAMLKAIVLWIFLAPVIGFVLAFLLMLMLMWIFHATAPHKLNRPFRVLQLCSSAAMAFTHGMNDAQKAMGAITLALVAAGLPVAYVDGGYQVPMWVIIACATVIAMGTGIGGWRVIRTLGHKMIRLTPVHGFAAETAAAGSILFATALRMPVSTTHVITSAIMGVGASRRLSAVRWGVATNIVIAWIFTLPACALAGGLLYAIVLAFGLR